MAKKSKGRKNGMYCTYFDEWVLRRSYAPTRSGTGEILYIVCRQYVYFADKLRIVFYLLVKGKVNPFEENVAVESQNRMRIAWNPKYLNTETFQKPTFNFICYSIFR